MQIDELVVIVPEYDVDHVLPGQISEILALEPIQGYRLLPGRFEAVKELFTHLPKGIIHFVGHGVVKLSPQGIPRYSILLEDLELDLIAWKGLIPLKNDRHPFYFFNACKVGQSHQVANMVDGWAPAVLEKGASGYIGALWPVADKSAAEFAKHFYGIIDEKLKQNSVNVAEAIRDTRKMYLKTGDLTYLAYIFYGDPNLEFVRHFENIK